MLEIKSRHLTWGGPKYYSRRMCLFSGVQERERQTVKEESNYVAFPHFQVGQWTSYVAF